jgi:hypothetical protein
VNVQQQARVSPGARRQERAPELQGNAVEVLAQHEPQARVAHRHERERHQEVLAKLLVRGPRCAVAVALERERVDEDGTPGRELHAVSARVAKHEACLERAQLDIEREQGGVAQLTEAPLLWM